MTTDERKRIIGYNREWSAQVVNWVAVAREVSDTASLFTRRLDAHYRFPERPRTKTRVSRDGELSHAPVRR